MTRWILRSHHIFEVVEAPDQWAAWNTLRLRPTTDFGLLVTAEADEDGNPIAVRTSRLMFGWGRDMDAHEFISAAVAEGLTDTTLADMAPLPESGTGGGS